MIGQSGPGEGPQERLAAACHADWAWFHAHKPATLRWRKARHGEFGNYERLRRQAQTSHVMVISLGDNHHLRLAFGAGVLGGSLYGTQTARKKRVAGDAGMVNDPCVPTTVAPAVSDQTGSVKLSLN